MRFLDNDHFAYGDMMHQICNASFSGISTFKLDVIFVACFWDTGKIFEFQENDLLDECIVINFHHFVDLKTRFLDNDHFP